MNELCCCPVCGKIIDYWQYHRNDIQSECKCCCYDCENYLLKEIEYERRRNKIIHTDGCE